MCNIEEADGLTQGGIQTGSIYDIEPDQSSDKSERAALPRRVRFYRSVIDANNLRSGADYSQLKDVIVIMLLPYDPFGCGRTLYTVKNTCLEEPKMPYEDGALNLFLYTKGVDKAVTQELRDLLQYLENTTWDKAVNDSLREIQAMVDNVKHDKEVSISYMKIYERERMIRNEGLIEGRNEGLADSVKYLLSEFGTLPESIAARISNEKSPDTLNRWLKLAAKSDSIEEFTQKM